MQLINEGALGWQKLVEVGSLDVAVLPVVVQDHETKQVIMIAYLSREALAETVRTGRAVFYSTSRGQLHRKGETSGDVLEVVELWTNCDLNSVLMEVRKLGTGACHERDAHGRYFATCFRRRLSI